MRYGSGVIGALVLVLISSKAVARFQVTAEYLPTWKSLDSRPLPQWYDDAKIGIFVHWGVFSVPSFGSEWFWHNWRALGDQKYVDFMSKSYPPGFSYQDFAKDFTAEFFNPDEWAEIFKSSGAKYVVLTSKHHEGYTLWPSKYSYSWNSQDVGPHKDLVGELATSVRHTGLKFGLYHSLYEWFNPLWVQDKSNSFSTNDFITHKVMPEMMELIEKYEPEVLWSDGEWEAPDWYWNSTVFLAWLYNSSPVKETVVSNDRWGDGILCTHGDFYTCQDRYNPGVLQAHKWENAMTIDRHSWGFRREAKLEDFLSYEDLVKEIVITVSCGGNILVNVGPTKYGRIAPIYEERLRQMGKWLSVNGEAIYNSRPWTYQNETVTPGIWYTKHDTNVYVSVLEWPVGSNILTLNHPEVGPDNTITILGHDQPIPIKSHFSREGLVIMLPDISKVSAPLPWVLKLTQVIN